MDRRGFCLKLLGSGLVLESLGTLASAETAGISKKLKWHKTLKPAHKLAIESDKPMLIVFGATWCHYCHKLERETLGDERMVALIERDFIPVLLDFDHDKKVAKILEVERLPCTVILSPEADLLQKSEGFADYTGYVKILQASMEQRAAIRQVKNQSSDSGVQR
ncbi:MAG: thioredoxin family protein [Planctomycetes bacterium]|nr:thioredoxin family protein [Planctomycetota bacterium]